MEDGKTKQMKLLEMEDFESLLKLNAIQIKVHKWMAETKAQTEEEALHELRRLPEYCKHWTALQDVLLSAEELRQSGTRQQNLHFLNAMPLAFEDSTKLDDSTQNAE